MLSGVWHLYPGHYRYLWVSLACVLALYVPHGTKWRVVVLCALNVLPASSHPLVLIAFAPFLPYVKAPALISRAGLASAAVLHVLTLSALSSLERSKALRAARADAWRPVPSLVRRGVTAARLAHVVVFGAFPFLLLRTNESELPPYCVAFVAMHFGSAVVMGAAAVFDRAARQTSVALLLAPSRYINWALQVREALASRPHDFPLFSVAMACESIRVANQMLIGLLGPGRYKNVTGLDPNSIGSLSALVETLALVRAVGFRGQRLLYGRWVRAPQLLQGALLGIFDKPPKLLDQKIDRRLRVRVYEPCDDDGRKVVVDMREAPGMWRVRDNVETTIATHKLAVKLPGAMRELALIDGIDILGTTRCVAKAYTRGTTEWLWGSADVGDGIYFRDAHLYHATARLVDQFNRALDRPSCKIAIIPCVVIEILEADEDKDATFDLDDRKFLTVEPFIDGAFQRFSKFNSNAFNANLLVSDRHADPVCDAFSHFSHHVTNGDLLVCDIQGVRTHDPLVTITDPQIITRQQTSDFGCGNGGSDKHIQDWFASHECRGPCRALGLTHPCPSALENALVLVLKQLAWYPFFVRGESYYSPASWRHSSTFAKRRA